MIPLFRVPTRQVAQSAAVTDVHKAVLRPLRAGLFFSFVAQYQLQVAQIFNTKGAKLKPRTQRRIKRPREKKFTMFFFPPLFFLSSSS
jgi:hypothetical protein